LLIFKAIVVVDVVALLADETYSCGTLEVSTVLNIILADFAFEILVWPAIRITLFAILRIIGIRFQIIASFTGMTVASKAVELIAVGNHIIALPIRIVLASRTACILNANSLRIGNIRRIAGKACHNSIIKVNTWKSLSWYDGATSLKHSIIIRIIRAVWTLILISFELDAYVLIAAHEAIRCLN